MIEAATKTGNAGQRISRPQLDQSAGDTHASTSISEANDCTTLSAYSNHSDGDDFAPKNQTKFPKPSNTQDEDAKILAASSKMLAAITPNAELHDYHLFGDWGLSDDSAQVPGVDETEYTETTDRLEDSLPLREQKSRVETKSRLRPISLGVGAQYLLDVNTSDEKILTLAKSGLEKIKEYDLIRITADVGEHRGNKVAAITLASDLKTFGFDGVIEIVGKSSDFAEVYDQLNIQHDNIKFIDPNTAQGQSHLERVLAPIGFIAATDGGALAVDHVFDSTCRSPEVAHANNIASSVMIFSNPYHWQSQSTRGIVTREESQATLEVEAAGVEKTAQSKVYYTVKQRLYAEDSSESYYCHHGMPQPENTSDDIAFLEAIKKGENNSIIQLLGEIVRGSHSFDIVSLYGLHQVSPSDKARLMGRLLKNAHVEKPLVLINFSPINVPKFEGVFEVSSKSQLEDALGQSDSNSSKEIIIVVNSGLQAKVISDRIHALAIANVVEGANSLTEAITRNKPYINLQKSGSHTDILGDDSEATYQGQPLRQEPYLPALYEGHQKMDYVTWEHLQVANLFLAAGQVDSLDQVFSQEQVFLALKNFDDVSSLYDILSAIYASNPDQLNDILIGCESELVNFRQANPNFFMKGILSDLQKLFSAIVCEENGLGQAGFENLLQEVQNRKGANSVLTINMHRAFGSGNGESENASIAEAVKMTEQYLDNRGAGTVGSAREIGAYECLPVKSFFDDARDPGSQLRKEYDIQAERFQSPVNVAAIRGLAALGSLASEEN